MNFEAMKGIMDMLVKSFVCPDCKTKINEVDIDIVGAAGSTVNLDITCPKCGRHSIMKSELKMMDLKKMNLPKEKLEEIQKQLEIIKEKNLQSNPNKIKDDEIVELHSELKKKKINVSDLFGN